MTFNPFEKNKELFEAIEFPHEEEFIGTFMDHAGRTTYGVWDYVSDGEYHSNVWDITVTGKDGNFVVAKVVEN